ncbi:collagenase ColA [Leptospira interrogans]|uniref:microbial collagenase n=11 Tax=Leptospira interrogans TaxID=173 RepID=A0A1B9FEL5_LEPIR|nr:collagenase [Leptospira interrogans]APH42549.1 Peptidase family M9 N-terminal domain protein [Leptospira interrogans serovar Copenhageni/Icterohaemorrhagiae]AAS71317.1 microbial collagenase precursor [Leptospira interrogans serovar Copenhageni str. Fiocruz L1-130]ALE38243.1 microbial collagenase [Leptospira interrogans serovar Hardjo str. Norma]ARB95439.1 collagenase [Leptospira interrogans serovar Copenhageni]ASP42695.1 collagenase [Leptospira interrogans]
MITNIKYKLAITLSVLVTFSLGCNSQNNGSKNDLSLFATMFAQATQQTTMRSTTVSVSSLNELIGFKPIQVENEQDFDRIADGKKRILVPSVMTFGPSNSYSNGTAQNITSNNCNGSYVARLKPKEFVRFLETHDINCVDKFVWNYDQYSDYIYSQENMLEVVNRLNDLAPFYNGNNDLNFIQLFRMFWAGYYVKHSHPSLPFDTNQISQALVTPMQIFASSAHFLDGTNDAGKVLEFFFTVADSTKIGHTIYPRILSFLEATINDPQRLRNNLSQAIALNAVFRLFQRHIHSNSNEFLTMIDYRLISKLRRLALDTSLNTDSQVWIINNAIFGLDRIYEYLPSFQPVIASVMTDVLETYPYISEPYLLGIKALTRHSDCANLRIGRICLSDIKETVKKAVLSNTYYFDDKTQIVHTALSIDEIQPLYHALKQVESQFFRLIGIHAPVSGDTTDSITMYVYKSRKDYETFHPFLFDLSTDNGGIYIERDKTLYTYQRTPAESIYTLEELLRHEYSHYLVGRFIIPGLWSQTSAHDNERLTWFEEGIAEFLTGSSSREIHPRKSLISEIKRDGSSRMDVSKILTARYGDFKFYRYSGNFFNYLYTYKKDTLKDLISALRDSNIQTFDFLIDQMSHDTGLNTSFQAYLDYLVSNVDNLTDPSTPAPDLANLSTNDPKVIRSFFRKTETGLKAKCTTAAFGLNSRFSCRGLIFGNATYSPDWNSAWSDFNSRINDLMSTLESSGVNNFQSMNCRIGEIRFDKHLNLFRPFTIYSCEGPLAYRSRISYRHPQRGQTDFRNTRIGIHSTCFATPSNGSSTTCNTPIVTNAFSNTATYEEMYQKLNGELNELKSEVYTMRPSFYKKLDCNFDSIDTIHLPDGRKYLAANSSCNF